MESLQPRCIFSAEVCKRLNMIQQKRICCCLARPCGNFFKTLLPPLSITYVFVGVWFCNQFR